MDGVHVLLRRDLINSAISYTCRYEMQIKFKYYIQENGFSLCKDSNTHNLQFELYLTRICSK